MSFRREDFSYELPEELIAQYPLPERSASRLLHLDGAGGEFAHRRFLDLPELLRADDLLVFNNTRVIPARLLGHKETGGRVEVLVERLLGEQRALAHIRASKTPREGSRISVENGGDGDASAELIVGGRVGELFEVESPAAPLGELLARFGHVPLPPYIARADEIADRERYQTVVASRPGAVAAPTAGLHFDDALLATLAEHGVQRTELTLHVGAGTFRPVRSDDIREHRMHAEYVEVPGEACTAIERARSRGGRVVAVGTTAVRSLESAAAAGPLEPFFGDTDLFIYPGYRFRVVDALITNFHLPESTLLMLVSAFAGREAVLRAYEAAVAERYRFFSYGDAMLLEPCDEARRAP